MSIVLPYIPTEIECSRELCRRSLSEFVKQAWDVLEPGQPYSHGWHIDAIAEHLEAVTSGDITRLLINVPPGPGWVENQVMTERGRVRLGDIKPGDMVLTHRGRYKPVTAVYSKGLLPTLKISTKSGRDMVLTADHNVLTPFGWVEAGSLKIGDSLGLVTPLFGLEADRVTAQEARLLGYLIGDGSLTQACVSFTNQEEDTVKDFENCALACGFETTKSLRKTHWQVRLLGGRAVHDWLAGHGLAKCSSYTKFVPAAILASSNDKLRNFLGAYWPCDGMINVKSTKTRGSHYHANATTVSEQLAKDLIHVLIRLGIRAKLRRKSRNLDTAAQPGGIYRSFTVEVYSQADTARFIDLPGLSARKNALAKQCTEGRFDTVLTEDSVIAIEDSGERECMCISVSEDHSLTWNDLAVHNTMKSMMTGVFHPAWEWGPKGQANIRFIGASHEGGLAIRDNLKMRRLIESDWYQARWPIQLTSDQNEKKYFENEFSGWRQACPVRSMTGRRGDRVLWDDPHNVEDAYSDVALAEADRIFKETLPTRLNNPDRSAIIIVMQRLSARDVAGTIIAGDYGYEHLCLPMEYEPIRKCVTSIGFRDPRTQEGEPLFPARFPPHVIERDKKIMGSAAWAGQMQQSPAPTGGNILKSTWWRIWPDDKKLPKCDHIFLSWDTAYSEASYKNNAHSAFLAFGVWWNEAEDRNCMMLLKAWSGQVDYPELRRKAKDIDRELEPDCHFIEKKASGYSLVQDMKRVPGVLVRTYQPDRDKVTRAYAVQAMLESGQIYAPDRRWADNVIEQIAQFPNGAPPSADLTDCFTQACLYLRNGWWLGDHPDDKIPPTPDVAANLDAWDEDEEKSPTRRLYG